MNCFSCCELPSWVPFFGNSGEKEREPLLDHSNDVEPAIEGSSLSLYDEIIDKWRRPATSLPVQIDLPRLIYKFEITDKLGQSLLPSNIKDMQRGELLKLLFDTLNRLFAMSTTEQTEFNRVFDELVEPTKDGDISIRLSYFLEHIGDNIPAMGVLKACNQSFLAPAVIMLKSRLGGQLRYKDLRDGWYINIQITDSEIILKHRKTEQSFESNPDSQFQFDWELTLTFNRAVTELKTVNLHVVDIRYSSEILEVKKVKLQNLLAQFYVHE